MVSDKEIIKINIINLYNSFTDKDIEGMLQLFQNDYDPIVIGTGEHEVTTTYDNLKKQFQQDINEADSISFDIVNQDIKVSGNIAWAFLELTMHVIIGNQLINLPLRTTHIFEKADYNWFIRHSHSSIPFNFQQKGYSYPTLNGIEETIDSWLRIFDVGIIEYSNKQKENELRHYLNQVRDVVMNTK